MQNLNTEEDLHKITNTLIDNIRRIELFTTEAKVEDTGYGDIKGKALEEQQSIKRENEEELSEKYRTNVNT